MIKFTKESEVLDGLDEVSVVEFIGQIESNSFARYDKLTSLLLSI